MYLFLLISLKYIDTEAMSRLKYSVLRLVYWLQNHMTGERLCQS